MGNSKHIGFTLIILLAGLLCGCKTTKFVPEGKYLLYKANIEVKDNKSISPQDLRSYLRQKQNTEIFGFWKLQLDIYNTASLDTAKWTSKNARKMGEAPVIFSPELTDMSCTQLRTAMQNKGFFHARVDTTMDIRDRQLSLTYHVTANEPYFIRNYQIVFEQNELLRIARQTRFTHIHEGMQFDASAMDQERERIATVMRRTGRYYFDKEFIRFIADSTIGFRQVDLKMCLQDYIENLPLEQKQALFRRYRISKVCFHMDYDPKHVPEGDSLQSSQQEGYEFTWVGKPLLRERMLIRQCPIEPGEWYNSADVEQAYTTLNQLAPIKYVDISFQQVSEQDLECHITLSRSKLNTVSAEVEGTYSAGDWGIGVGAGYANRNIFRGAETFSINAKCSYEWRQNGSRALEAKVNAGLEFPSRYAIRLGYQYQDRPDEYIRTILNTALEYKFNSNPRLQHGFHIIDISYVRLPWKSPEFEAQFLQPSNILKYSYEDHFIVGFNYAGNYTTFRRLQPHRSYCNLSYNVETAGNVLEGVYSLFHLPRDADGYHSLFGVRFAQYAKFDFNVTYHQIFDPHNCLVFHAGLGSAVPYGNSEVVPFEKRYFSGGANSVRGWIARGLGPGNYYNAGSQIDYNSQAGDIKLDLNLEYRFKFRKFLELAAFFDAGNIWTMRDYDSQPYGVFKYDQFYKQIAMSYGLGARFDFSFFIFRVDCGVKLFDPGRVYGPRAGSSWRTASNGLCWKDDVTWHFAIGYPF